MMSYLLPGYLRIGGTEADRLVFKDNTRPISSHPSPSLDPNNTFVMTGKSFSLSYRVRVLELGSARLQRT